MTRIEEIKELLLIFCAVMGAVTLFYYRLGQVKKLRAEMLEKFEVSVRSGLAHNVTEQFVALHGLRMNYTDVVSLIGNDECSRMIYVLRQTPGLVKYKKERLVLTTRYSTRSIFILGKFLPVFFITMLFLLLFALVVQMVFEAGYQAALAGVMSLGVLMMLGGLIKSLQYNKLILNLVQVNK